MTLFSFSCSACLFVAVFIYSFLCGRGVCARAHIRVYVYVCAAFFVFLFLFFITKYTYIH